MRCFLAIPASETVRKNVVRVQEILRRADADVKWTEEENLHLTLKFLGELGDAEVERLKPLVAAEAQRSLKLALTYAGVDSFRNRGNPTVIWAGVAGDAAALAALASALERASEQVGVVPEARPFAAHLTIGRVRSPRNAKRLLPLIDAQRGTALGADAVSGIVLIKSTLTQKGSVYEVLEKFPLGAPSP